METCLVVSGLVINDNKVLLIHHKKLDLWLPPGGHIEKNETPDGALIREIKEETSLDIEILNQSDIPVIGNTKKNLATPIYANLHSVIDHNHACLFYACRALNPEKLKINKELWDSKWLSKEDLQQPHIPKDVKLIALKAFELSEKLE